MSEGDPLIELTLKEIAAVPSWARAHQERVEILREYRRKVLQPVEAQLADVTESLRLAQVANQANAQAYMDTLVALRSQAPREER